MVDITALMKTAMCAEGITPPDMLVIDGEIHRFDIRKHGDKVGWYVIYPDDIPAGAFGDWREGKTYTWCAKPNQAMGIQEFKRHYKTIEQGKAKRNEERRRIQKNAQENARYLWSTGSQTIAHPYPRNKEITAYGARQTDQRLLIPMFFRDEFCNVQQIFPDGNKRFLKGARVKGCYLPIGDLSHHIYICEGYATGCSLHEYTGDSVAVAFNAGNLMPVAREIREKYPSIRITLAADNDLQTKGNPGLTKAREAAALVGSDLIYPDFSDLEQSGSDFNDYVIAGGVL